MGREVDDREWTCALVQTAILKQGPLARGFNFVHNIEGLWEEIPVEEAVYVEDSLY